MDFALGCTADREKDRTGQDRTGQDRTVLESFRSTIRLIINEAQRSSYA